MNPREFAREPGYDLTFALTYSFDPMFFENVVLHDLRVGGSGSIVVIGDPHEVDGAIANSQLALEHLGRRYMLSPATHSNGAFHPKLSRRSVTLVYTDHALATFKAFGDFPFNPFAIGAVLG